MGPSAQRSLRLSSRKGWSEWLSVRPGRHSELAAAAENGLTVSKTSRAHSALPNRRTMEVPKKAAARRSACQQPVPRSLGGRWISSERAAGEGGPLQMVGG